MSKSIQSRQLLTCGKPQENFAPRFDVDSVNTFFWLLNFVTKFWGSINEAPFTTFWSDSQKAFLRKRKCCLPLKSKSNQWVNSSILKSFEPKFSIFAMHQHPSFSPNLNIILKKCWYLGFWICPNFVDFFSTLIFDQIWIFKNVSQN